LLAKRFPTQASPSPALSVASSLQGHLIIFFFKKKILDQLQLTGDRMLQTPRFPMLKFAKKFLWVQKYVHLKTLLIPKNSEEIISK
jgi:hypothetical protein